jgi:hypothetical protein
MSMRRWQVAAATVAATTGFVMSAAANDPARSVVGGDPTPSCATHHEFDKIQNGMRPFRIEEIVGNPGWFIDTPAPGQYARGYRSCWAPGVRFVKVWFDATSDLSYDKAVVDV